MAKLKQNKTKKEKPNSLEMEVSVISDGVAMEVCAPGSLAAPKNWEDGHGTLIR